MGAIGLALAGLWLHAAGHRAGWAIFYMAGSMAGFGLLVQGSNAGATRLASWPRVVVRTFDSVSVASRSVCRERRGGRAENARTHALTLTLN